MVISSISGSTSNSVLSKSFGDINSTRQARPVYPVDNACPPSSRLSASLKSSNEDKVSAETFALEFFPTLFQGTFTEENQDLIKNFEAQFDALKNNYDKHLRSIQNMVNVKEDIDVVIKFLSKNQTTFLPILKIFLTSENYESVSLFLENTYDDIKQSEDIFPVLQNAAEICLFFKFSQEIKSLEKEHVLILRRSAEMQESVDGFYQTLSTQYKTCLKKGAYQLNRLILYRLLPLSLVALLSYDNKKVVKFIKQVTRVYTKGAEVRAFTVNRKKKNKWIKELEPKLQITLEKSLDVLNGQCSLTHRPQSDCNVTTMDILLKNEKLEFEKKLVLCEQMLTDLLEQHSSDDVVELNEKLTSKGFNLNEIKNLPQDVASWKVRLSDSDFKSELCRKNVESQMTKAKLLKQGVRDAISEKINIESKFLIFNVVKDVFEIISSVFQILFFVPECAAFLTKWGIDQFEKIIPIPGIELSFILNPSLDLSIAGLFTLTASHMFGVYFKPSEYSMKGYWLDLQEKLVNIGYNVPYVLLFIIKISFQLTDSLIDLCLRNKKSSITEMRSYLYLNDKLTSNRKSYHTRLRDLKTELNILKLNDINQTLNPKLDVKLSSNPQKVLRKYLIINNCPLDLVKRLDEKVQLDRKRQKTNQPEKFAAAKKTEQLYKAIDRFLETNHLLARDKIEKGTTIYQFDKLQVIGDALNSCEFTLFPEEVINFFKDHTNISLTDNSNISLTDNSNISLTDNSIEVNLAYKINEFFTRDDADFFEHYKMKEQII